MFYIEMSNAIGISRGAVASITTISGLSGSILMPVTLRVMKKTSLKSVILAGIFLNTLSYVGMMFSGGVFSLYFWALMRGVANTCFNSIILTTLLSRWFEDLLGLVSGIVFSASGMAGAVFNPIFTRIITTVGLNAAFLFRIFFLVLLTLPGTLFLLHEEPQELGLEPYRAPHPVTEKGSGKPQSSFSMPLKLCSLCFVLLVIYYIFVQAASRVCDNLAGYADSLGMTPAQGAALASALMVGNVVSKLIIGDLSDRIGFFKAAVIGLVITTVSEVMLVVCRSSYPLLLTASFFAGFSNAVATVSAVGLIRSVYGNEGFSAAMAVISPVSTLYAVFTIAYGILYDITGAYYATFALILVLNLISLAFLPLIRRQVERPALQAINA